MYPIFVFIKTRHMKNVTFYLFSSGLFLCMVNCYLPNLKDDGLSHLSQRL